MGLCKPLGKAMQEILTDSGYGRTPAYSQSRAW
jgi:hypothetical protein